MCEHAAYAVRKCPFLAQLAKEHGEEFATSIAIAPTKTVGAEPLPTGTDAVVGLAESFRLFHGPDGIVPLNKGPNRSSAASGSRAGCPYHAHARDAPSTTVADQPPTRAVPFATISLSNFGKGPNFGDFLRKHLNNKSNKPQQPNSSQQRPQRAGPSSNAGKAPHGPAGTSTGSGSSNSSGPLGSGSNLKPQRPLGDPTVGASTGCGTGRGFSSSSKPPGAAGSTGTFSSSSLGPTLGSSSSTSAPSGWSNTSSSLGSVRGPSPFQQQRLGSGSSGTGSSSANGSRAGRGPGRSSADSKGSQGGGSRAGGALANSSSSAAGGAPGCPLRKWLGPMAGLVFNQYDKLICPPPIVAARAALASTTAVKQLRPQALPVKLVAVAAVVAGINMPCGAVREHFEKFSVGWFIAVHATIPFVAMLRKAVIMPKYAMVVTIAAAVMGQVIGSRLERMRLRYEQEHGPLLPLQLSLPLQREEVRVPEQQVAGKAAVVSSSSSRGVRRSLGSRGADAEHSMAERANGRGRGRHWREQLAADPEPAADELLAARCSSGVGGLVGGMFARLPVVKA